MNKLWWKRVFQKRGKQSLLKFGAKWFMKRFKLFLEDVGITSKLLVESGWRWISGGGRVGCVWGFPICSLTLLLLLLLRPIGGALCCSTCHALFLFFFPLFFFFWKKGRLFDRDFSCYSESVHPHLNTTTMALAYCKTLGHKHSTYMYTARHCTLIIVRHFFLIHNNIV